MKNRKVIGAACAAALAVGLIGTAAVPAAAAGPDTTYLVLAPQGKSTAKAAARVAAAGGTVVAAYDQIGVLVARSTNASFQTAVAGAGVDAVASTNGLGTTLIDDDIVEASGTAAVDASGDPTAEPLWGSQWDMAQIDVPAAHAITTGDPSVVVGVLDSGIDADHPDLAQNIDVADSVNCTDAGRPDTSATGWQPTTSDHGTHVAGTIAAADNGIGIVGVAPNVRLASVKVVNNAGFIYPEYAVCGFIWAGLHHMDVTNNSYYVDPFEFYCEDQADQYAAKEAVRRAVAWSTDQGVVHAAAAGNSAHDLADKSSFHDTTSPDDQPSSGFVDRTLNSGCEDIPTELPGVVTVSSMQRFPAGTMDSRLSGFSNRGLGKIDVAAPGSTILSTIVANNGYGTKSGTSMASPHVAGVLALMKSVHPTWTPAQMVEKLRSQADDKPCGTATAGPACVGPDADNSYFGEGVVDALDAVS